MKDYNYTISTNSIWTSFDHGTVQATNINEALNKATKELKESFDKVNQVLMHCDNTIGFTLDFDPDNIEIKGI